MATAKMANKNKVVMGIFRTRSEIENAVEQLKRQGFRNADISALLPSLETTKEFAHTNTTKMPEGATIGVGTGVAIGGALGWLAGIGSLVIPGVGPFIAAGPIMATLAGAGLGAATGGVVGALVGVGIPEYEANRFAGFIKDGGMLLSVHCDTSEWSERASTVLEQYGATDISTTSESDSDSPDVISKDIPRSAHQ